MVWRTLSDRIEIQGDADKHTDSVPRASPGSDTGNRVPSSYARRVVTCWEPCPRPTRSTHRENTLPTVSSRLPAMATWDRKPLAVSGSGSGTREGGTSCWPSRGLQSCLNVIRRAEPGRSKRWVEQERSDTPCGRFRRGKSIPEPRERECAKAAQE